MTGVNPFNLASWNLGGLNWNAWGEPNPVGLDDAPPVTTTPPQPPPAQATDTVTIGSNFTFDLGSYQPPNGWSQTDIPDLYDLYGGMPPPDLAIPELDSSYLLNWNFWLTTEDIFPAARTGVLTDEQALAVDYDAWNNSVAKQIGIDWPKYQQAVESARYEMQNTPSQAEQSGGSYSFSLSPSDRVSNWSNHPGVLPTITSSEAERINRIIDQYPARFQTKEDLISALASGGFNTIVVRGKNLGENAEGRDLNLGELKRLWVDMRMANYRTAQADSGGMDGFQNVGWPQNNRTPTGQSAIPPGAGAKSAPEAMAIAQRIASEESARTRALTLDYQLGGHNDLYDAERHARWVYRMSIEVGSGWASLFATAHELEGSAKGQPAIEAEMDRINNAIGMNAAINGTGMPTRSTPGLTYIKDGRLVKNGPE